MAIARSRGMLRGKQPKLSDKQQKELGRMHGTGEYSISDLAELFTVSRPTVYRSLGRSPSAGCEDQPNVRGRTMRVRSKWTLTAVIVVVFGLATASYPASSQGIIGDVFEHEVVPPARIFLKRLERVLVPEPSRRLPAIIDSPAKRDAWAALFGATVTADMAGVLQATIDLALAFEIEIGKFAERSETYDLDALTPEQQTLLRRADQAFGKTYARRCGPYIPVPSLGSLREMLIPIPIPRPPPEVTDEHMICVVLYDAGILFGRWEAR